MGYPYITPGTLADGGGMCPCMHGGPGWGMGPFGWVIAVFFWILVAAAAIAIIVFILSQINKRQESYTAAQPGGLPRAPGDGGRALEILKERLARGEISEEEYLRLKRLLEEE